MTDNDFPLPPTAAEHARPQLASIWRRAVCQLAAVRAASAGMVCGPTVDDRVAMLERAREELLQLERADALYAELSGGGSLITAAESALADLPAPTCWADAALARLLVCLSARVELELAHQAGSTNSAALAHEVEHVSAAHAALLELGEHAGENITLSRPFAIKWLAVALQGLASEAARAHYLSALAHEFGLSLAN